MFSLLTQANRAQLVKGTILLKYPINGEPVATAPTDPYIENSSQLRIAEIYDNEQTSLEFPPLPPTQIAGMGVSVGNLSKKVSEMIEDKTWWIYTPQTS